MDLPLQPAGSKNLLPAGCCSVQEKSRTSYRDAGSQGKGSYYGKLAHSRPLHFGKIRPAGSGVIDK